MLKMSVNTKPEHIEIERKFLVKGDFTPFVSKSYEIIQAYIVATKEKTVRVRVLADNAFLTIKGEANENGFSRFEWEKKISVDEAKLLLQLCEKPYIKKIRNEVIFDGKVFEIDVFADENEGLVMAELELASEDEKFNKPNWLGEEVTQDKRYYNAYLSENPYKSWNDNV